MKAEELSCSCGHGEDDMCLNGLVYEACGSEFCGGACEDTGPCKGGTGCCARADLIQG